ncbi:ABC transporter ATP-binding protein [Dolosicoccus paucivorans]|uniref:ABC transporter ATP-binding protein n=1 Tax=Dolosicoccus paucivorans TaxID=84521 RepID=A0A1G8M2Z3_9LACT|nr:ABC transporter ATP-binding protein [Dolosicoccus paucivorans]PMC58407.1 ABC transporter ATP-binding protein [Dolosicoccus paucivorans]SDI62314.1 peptide/nickel transport system ATP-binding protein [Dolosicoccus paucivorans]
MDAKDKVLLEVHHLETAFRIGDQFYNAVDDVSFTLSRNEKLAIVGESGSGKSTLATSIIGLHNKNNTREQGQIMYKGRNLLELTESEYNEIRGADISMIFQDPLSSLNPLMTVGAQIDESLLYHTKMSKDEREKRVIELLDQVGIANPERMAKQYPHELSGGMRQRVIIAIALACKPEIIIADEPTTALDVTIQAQILDLLNDIQEETESGIILITHDLGVVAETADRVAVMYAGQFVEIGTVEDIFNNPKHPYTRSLLRSIPQSNEMVDDASGELHVIQGVVPPITQLPEKGCRFAPRIPWIPAEAHEEDPVMHEVAPGHFVRCTCYQSFYFEEEAN